MKAIIGGIGAFILIIAMGLGAAPAGAATGPEAVTAAEGCDNGAECKPPPEPQPVIGDPHPADTKPPALTTKGLGRLTGTTAFTMAAIRAALPGFKVSKSERQTEGMVEAVFRAERGGEPALEIGGERSVESISVLSKAIAGPGGVRIGDTMAEVIGKTTLDECYRGVEDEAEMVICSAKGDNIGYWFTYPMPRKREPDMLAPRMLPKSAPLVSMFWFQME
ncbi:MAG: hypothetical protein C0605_03240 [Hyphomicrobiales bacterium]|nr:MAG: hypothetical protein C0605_03240 [Hyphomicrobiales bacterium]